MLAVVDSKIPPQAAQALEAEGYSLLRLPPHPALPPSVASHPDMLLFFGRDRIYTTRLYAQIARKELKTITHALRKEPVMIDGEVGADYPRDVLLNILPAGESLICHATASAREIREKEGRPLLPVRQGYAKCSAIPVGRNGLISADPSILKAAEQIGMDLLRLERHGVFLEGYDTGFIGGAASFAPYGKHGFIYFCGDLQGHPQGDEIQAFCQKHGYICRSLASIPLTDVGTIIILP